MGRQGEITNSQVRHRIPHTCLHSHCCFLLVHHFSFGLFIRVLGYLSEYLELFAFSCSLRALGYSSEHSGFFSLSFSRALGLLSELLGLFIRASWVIISAGYPSILRGLLFQLVIRVSWVFLSLRLVYHLRHAAQEYHFDKDYKCYQQRKFWQRKQHWHSWTETDHRQKEGYPLSLCFLPWLSHP